MEVLHTAPEASSFVLLAEHQSRTPASFYSGPPVLHYHSKRCKVVILERDLLATPVLNALRGRGSTANGSAANDPTTEEREVVMDGVDVWVTSHKFLLYAPATSTGVAIPYPAISLHAIQRLRLPGHEDEEEVQGLYMQIATPGSISDADDEEEEESIAMTIVPPVGPDMVNTATAETTTLTTAERAMEDQVDSKPEETPTQMFYAAVSACSNLHPDPIEDGDEDEDENGAGQQGALLQGSSLFRAGLISGGVGDGGLPPPVEGVSSGWITAENMHEYFDEEGNWIAGGEEPTLSLGPGAGTVRTREDDEGEETGNGVENGEGEETKWRRTD